MRAPAPDLPADVAESYVLGALRNIAGGDCWDGQENGDGCQCPACQARWALNKADSWRFEAACSDRLKSGLNPREARIVAAFRNYMGRDPDHRLEEVIRDSENNVTRRDWWVATSVVQWLATSVGMSVLEAAGFEYKRFQEDRELVAKRLPVSLCPTSCEHCVVEGQTQRSFCGWCGRRINGGR